MVERKSTRPLEEADAVRDRYARRDPALDATRYGPLVPAAYLAAQERVRALIRLFKSVGLGPLHDKTLLEIGCGTGGNLLQLLDLGFEPEHVRGNELLRERLAVARRRLPQGISLYAGDASTLDFAAGSFDIVYQSMVFTSLLDDAFQTSLANAMWRWVRPGGGVLWYDFVYDNPSNPDVRGVPSRRIAELFPEGRIRKWRVTLAPPVGRAVTRIAPALYGLFNMVPWLRTHLLCWIAKVR
jgi:SAM-dependent methyltransferase